MGRVTVTGLGKAYRQYSSRWGRLAEWLLPGDRPRHQLHWVLRDISFEVEPGQAMGVIGINGAGKSTLLKLITGTTLPTCGTLHTSGRVAALLELGMGFHPEFTGRQNAIMAGQLLGYSRARMEELMPAIEAFADIGAYLDQPLRVYSSGMQMRLAFSVATVQRPDILIVDEALSVGDIAFQHKSMERIRAFREQGTTLLFVSHDKLAIQSLCDRALLLSEGRIAMQGEPEAVMDYYNAMLAGGDGSDVSQVVTESGRVQTRSGSRSATLEQVVLTDADGQPLELVAVGQAARLTVDVRVDQPLDRLVCGYMIKDRLGQPVFGTNTAHLGLDLTGLSAGRVLRLQFEFEANLGEGDYTVTVALHGDDTHINANYDWLDLAVLFQVFNRDRATFTGVSWLPTRVNCVTRSEPGVADTRQHPEPAHE